MTKTTFNNVTSVGLTEDNGVKVLAYSYDIIDSTTGVRKQLNAKGSRIVVRSQAEVLAAIKTLEDFALSLADEDN